MVGLRSDACFSVSCVDLHKRRIHQGSCRPWSAVPVRISFFGQARGRTCSAFNES